MGHISNGAYGQWGHRGQWSTGIGYIGNDTHRGKVVQEVWVQGVWCTWPIRPTGGMGTGVWGTGVLGTWAIGHNGYRGYGVQGVWATGGMGHIGNGSHGQWGTWAMGPMGPWVICTFLPITSLILDGFLQKFYWT